MIFVFQYILQNFIDQGREVLCCAPTGSGKTVAFIVPLLHELKVCYLLFATNGCHEHVVILGIADLSRT